MPIEKKQGVDPDEFEDDLADEKRDYDGPIPNDAPARQTPRQREQEAKENS